MATSKSMLPKTGGEGGKSALAEIITIFSLWVIKLAYMTS